MHVRDMTYSHERRDKLPSHFRRFAFELHELRIYVCESCHMQYVRDMTHAYERRASFIRET